MKTLTIEYDTVEHLKRFISQNNICDEENILAQVFTSYTLESDINSLRNILIRFIPQIKIIGTTTSGEISNNGSLSNKTVISFSIFKDTKVQTELINYEETSFKTGIKTIKSFDYNNDELKLIISFTDGLTINGEEYLNGISSINEKIVIAGGMAGDYSNFVNTIIFTEKGMTTKGSVAAALFNEDLQIHTDYSFNWESIGKRHIITKSSKNRVYTIDDMTAVEFYKYYLGDDIAKLLPKIGVEFPLVIKRDGINIARAALTKHNDGSLSFAGNIQEGSIVQFGHGDVQMIVDKGLSNVKAIIERPIESIFIYSCMARKALLNDDINLEILPLRELAPISGFFTYGEFFHNCYDKDCKTQLLNQTMTLLSLSEGTKKVEKVTPNIFSHNPSKIDDMQLHRTQALSNLIEKTTSELEEFNQQLEKKVYKEIEKNKEKDAMLQLMQGQTQLGELIEMIIHQWRQPLSAITSSITSAQVYQEAGMLDDDKLANTLDNVLSYTEHLNTTIEDFRNLFKSNMTLETIEAKELIQKATNVLKPLLNKYNIELIEDFNCSSSINVSIGLMMQVVLNIVKNGIDILLEKNVKNPQIKIITKKENDNLWVLEIKDNAGGIPEDILPKIFEKRFTTKSHSHGTGLGLDMSKTIIESKLNGILTAHNEDEGAVFTIKLPI